MQKLYPSDLTDSQWQVIEKILGDYRKRKWDLRLVTNAVFYLVKTGIQWRYLPSDYPPWQTVYYYYRKWRDLEVWDSIHEHLYVETRLKAGRQSSPSLGLIDSQSVQISIQGGQRGYDAGKKIKGRKRHLVVDTIGLLMAVVVHKASIQDRDGAKFLLKRLFKLRQRFPRLSIFWADGAYAGTLVEWVRITFKNVGWKLQIVKKPELKKFIVIPKRWVVERTIGWLSMQRRLSKDYELHPKNAELMVKLAMIKIMINRI